MTKGVSFRALLRLNMYLKNATSKYVATKSKTFNPVEIDTFLTDCMSSEEQELHHMGVTIALMYYGLVRVSDLLKLEHEDVQVRLVDVWLTNK